MEKRHREDQAVEQLTLTREVSVEVCQGKVFQAAILQVAHRTDAEVAAEPVVLVVSVAEIQQVQVV
jgi:hypothetical protein